MKVFLVTLLITFAFAKEDIFYKEAIEYLNGKDPIITKTTITNKNQCQTQECMDEFRVKKKKKVIIIKKEPNTKKIINLLQKSFEKNGNTKAAKKLIAYLAQKKEKKYQELKQKITKELEEKDECFFIFNNLKKDDNFLLFKSFEKAKKVCKKNSLEYKIASKKIQKIQENIKQKGLFEWIIFKIKLFISHLLEYLSKWI